MRKLISYISVIAIIAAACSRETMDLENGLVKGNCITFAANNSRMITKAGLEYSEFEEGNRYLLFGLESSIKESYAWSEAVMYDIMGVETADHLIDYEDEKFFEGKTLDFYGATLCSDTDIPDNISVASAPVISLSVKDNSMPDLMYSTNLKGCTAQDGLLEMHFTHALSKVQVEVSKQAELEDAKIKELSIVNTSASGTLDIVEGKWSVAKTDTERLFFKGEMEVTTDVVTITDHDGGEAQMLIFPNEDSKHIVSVRIVLSTRSGGEKTYTYPLFEAPADGQATNSSPFIFKQNHRYVLSIILLNDDVRVLAVRPQAFDWIDVDLKTYLGQPVNFGGLMWMDRNLGATNWDCENDWKNTRGFYYQFGRNIPYIFDDEKFINRPATDTKFTDFDGGSKTLKLASGYKTGDRDVNLDIGYEYFFTYDNTGKRVYGAVQGGVLHGQDRFFVDGEWDGNVWKGSKLFTWLNPNQSYYRSNDGTMLTQAWNFYNAAPIEYDEASGKYVEKYAETWPYADVTSSNIAINPGDPGLYHFIIDARYYTDFYQSGSWCVLDHGSDCSCKTNPTTTGHNEYRRTVAITAGNYLTWLKDGCDYTTVEDVKKVNNLWAVKKADGSFEPLPNNHPCPKGWRIPTGEDFAGILPDPKESFYSKWGTETGARDLIAMYNATGKKTGHTEDILYGKEYRDESQEEVCHTIYIIKHKGEKDCYRLRIKWYQSTLSRNEYYKLGGNDKYEDAYGPNMRYVEITRYPGSPEMSFEGYETEKFKSTEYKKLTESEYWRFHTDFADWENPTETMQIPLSGFIYTGAGLDCLYFDGAMTILRCTDWNNNNDLRQRVIEAGITDFNNVYNKCNEAQNWCAYLRTDNAQCGVFDGSRKTLGCPIRCVRDVNAQ